MALKKLVGTDIKAIADVIANDEYLKELIDSIGTSAGIIRGIVTSAAVIKSGSGFKVSKVETGVYKIELEEELPKVGVMVGTAISVLDSRFVSESNAAKKIFFARIFKESAESKLVDREFNFMIMAIA